MAAADQTAAGVDWEPTTDLNVAGLDGFPRFARSGQADVVDRQVLAGGEAIVHLEAVEVIEMHPCTFERIVNSRADVR